MGAVIGNISNMCMTGGAARNGSVNGRFVTMCDDVRCAERAASSLVDFDQRVAVGHSARLEQFVQTSTRLVGTHCGRLDREGAFKCVGATRRDSEFDHHPDHYITLYLRPRKARPHDGAGSSGGLCLRHEFLRGDGVGVEGCDLRHEVVLLLAGISG